MKKILKIVRNYIGKYLFIFLSKRKRYDLFPFYAAYFPKSGYKAMHILLQKGYLELAYQVSQTYIPKASELYLTERIASMMAIKENGFVIEKDSYVPIGKLKPLFVVHNSLPYDAAGYALRTHTTVSHLKENGINIDVVTRPGYPWDLQVHREKPYHKEVNVDGVVYRRLEDLEKTFKRGKDENYIRVYAEALEAQIDSYGYSMLHAHSNYLNGLSAIRAGAAKKLPVIYEMRGLWHVTRTTLDASFEHAGMYAYESQMERVALTYADRVVVISEALKELAVSWGVSPEKIHLIPNAVDTEKFMPASKDKALVEQYTLEKKCVVGFLGSLTGYEGLKELVKAVEELIAEGYNDLVLMIVGEGREKERLVKESDLSDLKQVIFTGRVPYDEVMRYYSLFDICPFPRNNYEVCRYVPPLKVLEAMAMEKAVIVSNVAPLLEMVQERKTGLVCEADSVESLKVAIVRLYEEKDLRSSLGKHARAWVETHRSWEKNVTHYRELYGTLSGERDA